MNPPGKKTIEAPEEKTLAEFRSAVAAFKKMVETARTKPVVLKQQMAKKLDILANVLLSSGIQENLRLCRMCKRPFVASRADAKFCGVNCRTLHHYHKAK